MGSESRKSAIILNMPRYSKSCFFSAPPALFFHQSQSIIFLVDADYLFSNTMKIVL